MTVLILYEGHSISPGLTHTSRGASASRDVNTTSNGMNITNIQFICFHFGK